MRQLCHNSVGTAGHQQIMRSELATAWNIFNKSKSPNWMSQLCRYLMLTLGLGRKVFSRVTLGICPSDGLMEANYREHSAKNPLFFRPTLGAALSGGLTVKTNDRLTMKFSFLWSHALCPSEDIQEPLYSWCFKPWEAINNHPFISQTGGRVALVLLYCAEFPLKW